MHQRKVIHRDLKPENILFINEEKSKNNEGSDLTEIKIIDFGLSRIFKPENSTQIPTVVGKKNYFFLLKKNYSIFFFSSYLFYFFSSHLFYFFSSYLFYFSSSNLFYFSSSYLGTPLYVAPEIVEEKNYFIECDCWSIGVVTYFILSGKEPFYAKSIGEVYEKIRSG